MPKLKTHKGTKKRVRQTKRGKLIHGRSGMRHNLTKKSSKRKRRLSRAGEVFGSAKRTILKKLNF